MQSQWNLSDSASIDLSIVQGSGTGPTLYLVMKSYLRTITHSHGSARVF